MLTKFLSDNIDALVLEHSLWSCSHASQSCDARLPIKAVAQQANHSAFGSSPQRHMLQLAKQEMGNLLEFLKDAVCGYKTRRALAAIFESIQQQTAEDLSSDQPKATSCRKRNARSFVSVVSPAVRSLSGECRIEPCL